MMRTIPLLMAFFLLFAPCSGLAQEAAQDAQNTVQDNGPDTSQSDSQDATPQTPAPDSGDTSTDTSQNSGLDPAIADCIAQCGQMMAIIGTVTALQQCGCQDDPGDSDDSSGSDD